MSFLACSTCSFELWNPITELNHSAVGLYDDERFIGRSLVVLNEHYELLEDLPPEKLLGFMTDIQETVNVIKKVTGSRRVNVAILGNREPHVHAHLIPRYPEGEIKPDSSPWDDPRKKSTMPENGLYLLQNSLIAAFKQEKNILEA